MNRKKITLKYFEWKWNEHKGYSELVFDNRLMVAKCDGNLYLNFPMWLWKAQVIDQLLAQISYVFYNQGSLYGLNPSTFINRTRELCHDCIGTNGYKFFKNHKYFVVRIDTMIPTGNWDRVLRSAKYKIKYKQQLFVSAFRLKEEWRKFRNSLKN